MINVIQIMQGPCYSFISKKSRLLYNIFYYLYCEWFPYVLLIQKRVH
jgi:hypothetical protein